MRTPRGRHAEACACTPCACYAHYVIGTRTRNTHALCYAQSMQRTRPRESACSRAASRATPGCIWLQPECIGSLNAYMVVASDTQGVMSITSMSSMCQPRLAELCGAQVRSAPQVHARTRQHARVHRVHRVHGCTGCTGAQGARAQRVRARTARCTGVSVAKRPGGRAVELR